MRSLGVRSIFASCDCGRRASVDVSAVPDARARFDLAARSAPLWGARLAPHCRALAHIGLASKRGTPSINRMGVMRQPSLGLAANSILWSYCNYYDFISVYASQVFILTGL